MSQNSLYIDVCCLCRPFDDQRYLRIKLETNALYLILEKINQGDYKLLYSKVHIIEINDIKNSVEKNELLILLKKIGKLIKQKDIQKTRKRAEQLYENGLGLADAAHLSLAESEANYLISCDDSFIKKGNRYSTISILNPIEFCLKEDLR